MRGWNEGVAGLPYIYLCVGVTLGYICNLLQVRKYEAIMKDPNRTLLPEDRLYGAMFLVQYSYLLGCLSSALPNMDSYLYVHPQVLSSLKILTLDSGLLLR